MGSKLDKLGIFRADKSDWNVRSLEDEAERRGIDSTLFSLEELVGRLGTRPRVSSRGRDLEKFDALVIRWAPGGSAEQIVFRMDVLHRLENLGVKVIPLSHLKILASLHSAHLISSKHPLLLLRLLKTCLCSYLLNLLNETI